MKPQLLLTAAILSIFVATIPVNSRLVGVIMSITGGFRENDTQVSTARGSVSGFYGRRTERQERGQERWRHSDEPNQKCFDDLTDLIIEQKNQLSSLIKANEILQKSVSEVKTDVSNVKEEVATIKNTLQQKETSSAKSTSRLPKNLTVRL